ncbi:DUF2213 domain-containing protein [Sphingomonas crocodyli]|uniref:DUF2213 domain-containing protein n=2 Tax=Sphingomonas crocodyli TaxID=1979270 RepID=A0A437MBT5_9SPHN|nr:DUF2213 domain-containing protein [Sphingomonas crocodyli]
MVASVLAARVGIQDYAGYEVGKPDMSRVRVYRPAEEVFSRDSMRSFAAAPVTIDHPREAVTPWNWKDHAVGEVASDDIVKDGEAIRVPFLLRDAEAISTVLAGKREISMGYDCTLDWTPGQTADGEAYDAIQRGIRINHLAIVDRARGGPSLRIGDGEMTTKTITFDGLPLLVTDAAEAVIGKLQAQIGTLTTAKDGVAAELATAKTTIEAKDGEIAALKQQVADAEVTPAKLQSLADARAKLIDTAKKIAPAVVTDGKTDAEIRKGVVLARLGDAAKDMSDAAIEGAFAALTPAGSDALRDAITQQPISVGDARAEYEASRAKQKQALSDAWKQPAAANAA